MPGDCQGICMAPVNFHVPQPIPSTDPEMRKPTNPDPVLLAEPNVEPSVPAPKMKPVEPVIMARVSRQPSPAAQPDTDMTDEDAELKAALAMSMEGVEEVVASEQTNEEEDPELAAAIALSMQDSSSTMQAESVVESKSEAAAPEPEQPTAASSSSAVAPSAAEKQQQLMLKVRELHGKYVAEGMDANAAAVRAMKEAQDSLK